MSKEAPERIWIDGDSLAIDSRRWHRKKRFDNDLEYVSADIADAARVEQREATWEVLATHRFLPIASHAGCTCNWSEALHLKDGDGWHVWTKHVAAAIRGDGQ